MDIYPPRNVSRKKRKIGLTLLYIWILSLIIFVIAIRFDSNLREFFSAGVYSGWYSNAMIANFFFTVFLLPTWVFLIGNRLMKIIVGILMSFVVLSFLVFLFILRPHKLRGSLMSPVLTDSDYILAEKISYYFSPPRRGDVVVYVLFSGERVGRIVGLPGEKVEVANNKVFINGTELNEPYAGWGKYENASPLSLTLKEDEYWAPFDNRISNDLYATVSRKDISGRVFYVYWPSNRAGFLKPVSQSGSSKFNVSTPSFQSCHTLGTKMIIGADDKGQIGCDIEVDGQIDLTKSYCEGQSTHISKSLVPDAYQRPNRYYATLARLDLSEEVKVFAYTLEGLKVECLPPLNK